MEFTENCDFNLFLSNIKDNHEKIMYLSIFVDSDDTELKKLYVDSALKHNKQILDDSNFYDAGFDLFLPKTHDEEGRTIFSSQSLGYFLVNKVDFNVKCCARIYNGSFKNFTPFYTYARSSISKIPLRLANNQGIIDAGYRGNLIGMFDNINYNMNHDKKGGWCMEKYSRILQICAPGLIPIYVNIVDTIEELGPSTSRGEKGFGSTGK